MAKPAKGLLAIASTELWERFSFYTMQYSLVLYATASHLKGGLGFSDEKALQIVASYGALVYATPLLGGYIADKYIGRRNAIHFGGILMAIGHFILAMDNIQSFYISLIFLAIGCGLFKPNITSLVGDLYEKEDDRRDSGYNIFYSGINIGALLSGIIGGLLNTNIGYYASFTVAGICMLIGVLNFKFFTSSIKHIGSKKEVDKKISLSMTRFSELPQSSKNGVYLFFFLCFMNIFWQIAYNQWAGLLNLLAERNTNRTAFGFTIPTLWFESLNSFFVVTIAPLLAYFYIWLQKRDKYIDLSVKLSLGYFFQGIACFVIIPAVFYLKTNPYYQASPWFQVLFYFFSTLAELFTIPVLFSATSILAPKGYEGRLMGVYIFVSLSLGTYLAGYVGSLAHKFGDMQIFLWLGFLTFAMGAFHLIINKKVNYFIDEAIV